MMIDNKTPSEHTFPMFPYWLAVFFVSAGAVIWYAVVESVYFYVHGPRLRELFSSVNANAGKKSAPPYRATWLAILSYVVLVVAYATLAVVPSITGASETRPSNATPGSSRDGSPDGARLWGAFGQSLWRAVVLSAAIYGTYDIATYITVHSYTAQAAIVDFLYGTVVLPVLVVAPAAVALQALVSAFAGPRNRY